MNKLIAMLLLLPALALGQQMPPPSLGLSYTGTTTGYASPPTTTVSYSYQGPWVTVSIASVTGTSNATTLTLTGMPAAIQPASAQVALAMAVDNGAEVISPVSIATDGTITFYKGVWNAAFTGSGTKGIRACTFTYLRY